MSGNIPTPDPQQLLPPLLACLPLSAFSARPPPDLLSLLSPILRQRLHVLTTSGSSSQPSWLPLLTWDRDEGAKLTELLDEITFEPHPVSGEFEVEDVRYIQYRRLDVETVHARFQSEQFQIVATYLWCMNDEGNAWRLSDLKRLGGKEGNDTWHSTLEEAESVFKERSKKLPSQTLNRNKDKKAVSTGSDEEDDDAYWAAYDRTPARTPAKRSPAPGSLTGGPLRQVSSTNELDYYDRYESEVQPAMDPYDPSEAAEVPDSTLNHHVQEFTGAPRSNGSGIDSSTVDVNHPVDMVMSIPDIPHQPRPLSASSRSSVERLEEQVEKDGHRSHAEIGIKQHISTDIKSLYRLARSVGISQDEFTRIVQTELECLSMMELD